MYGIAVHGGFFVNQLFLFLQILQSFTNCFNKILGI